VAFAPAAHRRRVAGRTVAAARPSTAPAATRAAVANERQGRWWAEVVELVDRLEFPHGPRFAAAYATVLSHALTAASCLRSFNSQARKVSRVSREDESMEARADGSQVIPGGRNAILAAAFEPPAPLRDISDALAELARAVDQDLATPDHAPATERAYAHDWDDFSAFCGRHDLEALPAAPQTLALYLKTLETQRSRSPAGLSAGTIGLSLPTLRRRLAAIASRHASAGLETPTDHPLVRKLLRRYSRTRGTAVRKKEPLLIERLPALLMAMSDDLPARRDRALLLLGYAGAFRRSELVALDVEHLRFSKRGLYVWIAAAKNDPRKKGRELYVPRLPKTDLCAVAALERWLETVGTTGPVFRTFDLRGDLTPNGLDAGDVARILRRRAASAGVAGDFAGHSLRRGFITNAAKKKVPIENIKRVTGQRSNAIVLDYVAAATLDDDPPLLEIVG